MSKKDKEIKITEKKEFLEKKSKNGIEINKINNFIAFSIQKGENIRYTGTVDIIENKINIERIE